MKFGTHMGTWMTRWDEDVLPYARAAAGIGYDAVELSLLDLDEGSARALGTALADLGLEVTCTTGLGADTDITSDDSGVRSVGVDELKRALDIAAALGSSLLSGVIFAGWGKCTQNKRETRWKRSVEGLRAVGEHAHEAGVRLGIEAINRYETDLVNTAQQAKKLSDDVGIPQVGILLDTYHMNIEEKSPATAIQTAGDSLFHIHFAENDRGVPGSGTIDWHSVMTALHEVSYNKTIMLEMFFQANKAVSPDLFVWRNVEPDVSDACRRALSFLRGLRS